MKFNKKLIVPFLSTIVGLSIAGGLGGAFAWYQYNTQVTTSFVGTSVADSSVLQIGHMDGSEMVWEKDFYPYASGKKQNLIPVTFGQLVKDTNNKPDCLGPVAYGYPEAGISGAVANPGYDNWSVIDANKGFIRFDLYLRALDANGALAAHKVYLSDLLIEANPTNSLTKDILPAVRLHLDVEDGTNRLISNEEVNGLHLYGPLDLDGMNGNDTTGGYVDAHGNYVAKQEITYGRNGETQTTTKKADIVAEKTNGKFGTDAETAAKIICTTKTTAPVKITVTVWLEGWAMLLNGQTDSQTGEDVRSAVWNPDYTSGVDLRFGMTFDTGIVRTEN